MPSYVVTGANRGIGLEFVRQISLNPENIVFALIRNKSAAIDLAALKATNNDIHILKADITDYEALKVAASQVFTITVGALDYLFNNAALPKSARQEYTLGGYPEGQKKELEQDLEQMFHINIVGVGSAKKVIALSSGLGETELTLSSGYAIAAPYSVSKAALNMVVAKYVAAYKNEGFIFLAISPRYVDTGSATNPLSQEDIEEQKAVIAKFRESIPTF